MNWTGGQRKRNTSKQTHSTTPSSNLQLSLPWAKKDDFSSFKLPWDRVSSRSLEPVPVEPIEPVLAEPIEENSETIDTQETSDTSLKIQAPKHILELCGEPDIENEVLVIPSKRFKAAATIPVAQYTPLQPLGTSTPKDKSFDSLIYCLDTPKKELPHSQHVSPLHSNDADEFVHRLDRIERFLQTTYPAFKSFQ